MTTRPPATTTGRRIKSGFFAIKPMASRREGGLSFIFFLRKISQRGFKNSSWSCFPINFASSVGAQAVFYNVAVFDSKSTFLQEAARLPACGAVRFLEQVDGLGGFLRAWSSLACGGFHLLPFPGCNSLRLGTTICIPRLPVALYREGVAQTSPT